MPRAVGQIDRHKSEAILNATASVVAERGLAAPIEAIARAAGVSKQTIYNHFGSKAELVRALVSRRAKMAIESLESGSPQHPQAALTLFAEALLTPLLAHRGLSLLRMMIRGIDDDSSELFNQVYNAGPSAYRGELSLFLERSAQIGAIDITDPDQAAEFFIGMVMGDTHLRSLMRQPSDLTPQTIALLAQEAATRFMRAYAPALADAQN